MQYYEPYQQRSRRQPTRTLTHSQIKQIEATIQGLEQEADKWKGIAKKWETVAKEEHERASLLEEQLEGLEEDAYQTRSQQEDVQAIPKKLPDEQVSLDKAENRIARMQEHLARAQADYENARKRLEKRYAIQMDQNIMEFLRDLLPILDNLDRAIQHAPTDSESDGVKLTRQMFLSTLAKYTVKPIEALGQPFNPQIHEALGTVNDPELPPSTVAAVELPGFTYREKLLRPAQVLITPVE